MKDTNGLLSQRDANVYDCQESLLILNETYFLGEAEETLWHFSLLCNSCDVSKWSLS